MKDSRLMATSKKSTPKKPGHESNPKPLSQGAAPFLNTSGKAAYEHFEGLDP